MGHSAMRKPSSEAVAICPTGRRQYAPASSADRTNGPIAAFHAGHLNTSSTSISQKIGTKASRNEMKSMGGSKARRIVAGGVEIYRLRIPHFNW